MSLDEALFALASTLGDLENTEDVDPDSMTGALMKAAGDVLDALGWTAKGATRCACAKHADGSTTTFLCPVHASTDPCLTVSLITGRRRKGTIRRGVCTACGHGGNK